MCYHCKLCLSVIYGVVDRRSFNASTEIIIDSPEDGEYGAGNSPHLWSPSPFSGELRSMPQHDKGLTAWLDARSCCNLPVRPCHQTPSCPAPSTKHLGCASAFADGIADSAPRLWSFLNQDNGAVVFRPATTEQTAGSTLLRHGASSYITETTSVSKPVMNGVPGSCWRFTLHLLFHDGRIPPPFMSWTEEEKPRQALNPPQPCPQSTRGATHTLYARSP